VRTFKVGDQAIAGLVLDGCKEKGIYSGWGGFCEYTIVTDHDAMVEDGVANEENGWKEVFEIMRPVDLDIPVPEAALLCTWREVYAAFTDFHLKKGDDVLIYGAGPVGLTWVKLGRLFGLGWIGVVEPLPQRRELALKFGADTVYSDFKSVREIKLRPLHQRLDAVIDAVGSPSIINHGVRQIKLGGSVCVYGVISDIRFILDKCKGPYNYNLFIHQWPTCRLEKEAQQPLCEYIRNGVLKASDFVTHTYPMEKINDALKDISSGKVIKCLLTYE
jgi:threonine dehydrogenase-like Zn-dependent dehydrogenase